MSKWNLVLGPRADARWDVRWSGSLGMGLLAALISTAATGATPGNDPGLDLPLDHLPLRFEAHEGEAVRFVATTPSHDVVIAPNRVELHPPGASEPLRLFFVGGRGQAGLRGEMAAGFNNHYRGNDPERWRLAVPTYRRVRQRDVYDGIDAVHYGRDGRLEFDLEVAPHADPGAIALGVKGADALRRVADDRVEIDAGPVRYVLGIPSIYQERDGERHSVAGRFVLDGALLRIEVDDYDPTRILVIDPTAEMVFSTLVSGSDAESIFSVASDEDGYAYLFGTTRSTDFPITAGAADDVGPATDGGQSDLFIVKIDTLDPEIVYATYFGGTASSEEARSIAVDPSGAVCITGRTSATDFPVMNEIQEVGGYPGINAYAARFDSTGALVYSTVLRGLRGNGVGGRIGTSDEGFAVAADASGACYYAGSSNAENIETDPTEDVFPTTSGSFAAAPTFGQDSIVRQNVWAMKIGASGGLEWSGFLGGGLDEFVYGIDVDGEGAAYVAGTTASSDFPLTAGGFIEAYPGTPGSDPPAMAFVAKIEPDGSALAYSTLVGPLEFNACCSDQVGGLAVDGAGSAYLLAKVKAGWVTTEGAFIHVPASDQGGGVLTKLTPDGSDLVWSTLIGTEASTNTTPTDLDVDASGRAVVSGLGNLTWVEAVGTFGDGFVALFSAEGDEILFATETPGFSAPRVSVNAAGETLYAVGDISLYSRGLPFVDALDETLNYDQDAYLMVIQVPEPTAGICGVALLSTLWCIRRARRRGAARVPSAQSVGSV